MKKEFTQAEKAKHYLRFLDDVENISAEYKKIMKGLLIGSIILSCSILLVFFSSPCTEILMLMLLSFILGMLTFLYIGVKNMLNTLIDVSIFFDRNKLEQTANNQLNSDKSL